MTPSRARLTLVLALALVAGGCARLFDHYDVGPSGLARADERLRRLIADTAGHAALADVLDDDEVLPSDPLLARMYGGVLAYHAGEYSRSAALLDTATLVVDERMTRSVSRAALALVSTDKVMPYQAGASERLLLHYYAALAWLRLGSAEDAAVEARRMALLLEREPPTDDARRRLHAAMRHASAAIFAAAGERADADVAWRNARLLLGDSTQEAQLPAPHPDSVDVYVFVDRGFVGHRAEQAISLWLPRDDVRRLRGRDHERSGFATLIAARVAAVADSTHDDGWQTLDVALPADSPQAPPAMVATADATARPAAGCAADPPASIAVDAGCASGTATDPPAAAEARERPGRASGTARPPHRHGHDRDDDDDGDRGPYLLRIAWPVFRDLAPPAGTARVRSDSVSVHAPLVRASVSAAVAEDLRADRPLLLARTIVRAAAKLAITRGIEDELREKDDGAADLFALVGSVTLAATEQADTRSWTLLPGAVEITRVRVPAGERAVEVEAYGRTVSVPVRAPGGSIRIEHVRLP